MPSSCMLVCDAQPDLLRSLGDAARASLLENLKACIAGVRSAQPSGTCEKWIVVFTGVKFPARYEGVDASHKLYGGFKRLNLKLGDKNAHWFMEGFSGAEIDEELVREANNLPEGRKAVERGSDSAAAWTSYSKMAMDECGGSEHQVVAKNDSGSSSAKEHFTRTFFIWRQSHLPNSAELLKLLKCHDVTRVAVTGIRASLAVQAHCQLLCDNVGLRVTAVESCIGESKPESESTSSRTSSKSTSEESDSQRQAILKHLLPMYCNEIFASTESFLEDEVGLDRDLAMDLVAKNTFSNTAKSGSFLLLSDCGRGGHMQLYMKCLLERSTSAWRSFPSQEWYHDDYWKEYRCPLGRKVVDFADEPQFSRLAAMYIRGRDFLEDKIKVMEVAADFMPKTWFIEQGEWDQKPTVEDDTGGPWFVKDADKNWGRSVVCCASMADCMAVTAPSNRYVVQQHVPNPLLLQPGDRKVHIKFYMFLLNLEDMATWRLWTRKDGYLSVSPNRWTREDLSADTQVTIIRSSRISMAEDAEWRDKHWPAAYPKCKEIVSTVIGRAVETGKLQGRPRADAVAETSYAGPGKRQFELLSADFLIDTTGRPWMFEFNLTPVLRDEDYSSVVNDLAEVREAIDIAMPEKLDSESLNTDSMKFKTKLWDFVGEFKFNAAAGV